MGLSVMGMMMVMMQVVRHAGLRPVEWREYSTGGIRQFPEIGIIARDLFTGKPELYRTKSCMTGYPYLTR